MVTSKASDEHADFSCDQCFDLSRFCCDKILTFAFHYNRRYFSITQGSAGRLGCKRIRKSVVNSSRKSLQETHFSETISCRNNGHGPRQCNKADGDNFKIVSDFTITCPFDTTIGCQSCIYDHFTRKWFSTAIWLKLNSTKKKNGNIKNISTKC